MNRRHALTTIGLSSLAGTLLASCGLEPETAPQSIDVEPEPSAKYKVRGLSPVSVSWPS